LLRIAEAQRDLALDVEREPLLGPPGQEVHVAAHRPEKVAATAEAGVFAPVIDVVGDQLLAFLHPVDIFGDPIERMQIAQAPLAVLDVGLDQIARLPGAAMALLALGKLGGDEFPGSAAHHLLVEAEPELVKELAVPEQEAGFEDRGAHRHIGLRLADALVDGTSGVADLEPHVPQAIEDRLGDGFAPGGLLVRQQEQEIDVGAGRQDAAAVAAGGDDRHVLGPRGIARRIKMLLGEFEQQADDLVLHEAEPLGAAATPPVLEQQLLGLCPPAPERGLEKLADGIAPVTVAAGVALGDGLQLGRDRGRIEEIGRPGRGMIGR